MLVIVLVFSTLMTGGLSKWLVGGVGVGVETIVDATVGRMTLALLTVSRGYDIEVAAEVEAVEVTEEVVPDELPAEVVMLCCCCCCCCSFLRLVNLSLRWARM